MGPCIPSLPLTGGCMQVRCPWDLHVLNFWLFLINRYLFKPLFLLLFLSKPHAHAHTLACTHFLIFNTKLLFLTNHSISLFACSPSLSGSRTLLLSSLSLLPLSLLISVALTHSLAAGEFAIATGSRDGSSAASNNIMKWRQGNWQAVVGGTGGPVYALSSVGGCMYVGGRFSRVCASELEVEIESAREQLASVCERGPCFEWQFYTKTFCCVMFSKHVPRRRV